MVAVVREFHGVLALKELEIARLDGLTEKIHLIAGVVHVKLAPYVVARAVEHGRQRVAQHAAARVADGHRPRGIRGDKLDHDLLAAAIVRAAKVRAFGLHRRQNVRVPARGQAEVQKARPRDLDRGKPRVLQLHVRGDRLGDLARCHVQRLGRGHGVVGGEVPVRGVLRLLHRAADLRARRQCALLRRACVCLGDELVKRLFCLFDSVGHSRLSSLFCDVDLELVAADKGVVKIHHISDLQLAAVLGER